MAVLTCSSTIDVEIPLSETRSRPKRSLSNAVAGPSDEYDDGSSPRAISKGMGKTNKCLRPQQSGSSLEAKDSSPGNSLKRIASEDFASTTTGGESPDSLGVTFDGAEPDEPQVLIEVAEAVPARPAVQRMEALAEAEAEAEAILKFQLPRAELVAVLAKMLTHLASFGTCRPHHLTAFHSATPPPISIHDYLERLAKHFRCSDECLLLALVYIDRVVKNRPDFVFTTRNAHRTLATALTVAAKFNDDLHYSNRYYAQCAGVKLQELNILEAQFILLVGWRFKVLPEEYGHYLRHIVNAGPARLLANGLA